MFDVKECRAYAKYVLKREMKKSVMNVEQLATLLNVDSQALHNKISRSSFSAGFLFQALNLLECKNIDLSDLVLFLENVEKNEKRKG
jgi:hypothetical protein